MPSLVPITMHMCSAMEGLVVVPSTVEVATSMIWLGGHRVWSGSLAIRSAHACRLQKRHANVMVLYKAQGATAHPRRLGLV